MKKTALFFMFCCLTFNYLVTAQTTLTHNPCGEIIKVMNHSCSSGYIYFARDFYLEDFEISTGEEITISQGQVGITYADWGATIQFNIYEIDDNFPDSFSQASLIGQSQVYDLPYISGSNYLITSPRHQIITVEFDNTVTIPANVKRILVEVKNLDLMHVGGTSVDDGSPSWYRGCVAGSDYVNTNNLGYNSGLWPSSDYNFYINVTGEVRNVVDPFSMNITNNCSDFFKGFGVTNPSEVASIVWTFGDPTTGMDNVSSELHPVHDFSADGTYTITAAIESISGAYFLSETIDVIEPPNVYELPDISACEDTFNTGISTTFDTSNIHSQIIDGRSGIVVSYLDGNGNVIPSPLPNLMSNTILNAETISVRVAYENNPCCYSETTFDLIVNQLPDLSMVQDLPECDDDNDGVAFFNLEQIKHDILGNNNFNIIFYRENGQLIPNAELPAVENSIVNEELLRVYVENMDTNCSNETTFKLIVNPLPIANTLNDLTGCDDNNDGISEYFDTSAIETTVLGNQTGMEVTYFDANGNQFSGPLPNPFTNTQVNQQTITVRVTNTQTKCYAETFLNLTTSTQPQINQPLNIYACDESNGIAYFDTSTIENQLIGNQNGLLIFYSDENGNQLPSPLPVNYQNSKAWSQTINVRVENEFSSLCYSITSFDLIVNELPQINLETDYFLCDLEPYLYLATDPNFDSWEWSYEDGSVISNSFEVNVIDAGNYTLKVSKITNGISCENSFSFNLIRSILPKIEEVKINDISDNNYIEIIAFGDGDFEYAIDGFNFQNDNTFHNLLGGVYTVQVRDKDGCGADNKEVVLVDYPKFFTPNNDGFNDYWHIQGIEKFPDAIIYIFDRFGKSLKKLTFNDTGWDGTFNGQPLFSSGYWFTADLGDGRNFNGHFSLIR